MNNGKTQYLSRMQEEKKEDDNNNFVSLCNDKFKWEV